MTKITNCAHRGASGHAPENTLAALHLAVKLGATMAEIDLQQTADDQLVLFHDDNLNRTSDGHGPLWEKSLPELQLLAAGSWFSDEFQNETIPTFEQAIRAMAGRLHLNIELKLHGQERDLVPLFTKKMKALDCASWCLVTSFDHETIDQLQDLAPHLKTGYIVGKDHWDDALLDSRVSVLSLEKTLVTAELVQAAHTAGKEVHVWTVNTKKDMKRLQKAGVDTFISNYPDKVAAFLNKD